MKTFKTIYRTQPASRRPTFAVTSTATGCAVLLLAAGAPALAADQPASGAAAEAPLEEIVVTGIRKSIQDSIAVKKNEQSIVEVVSAEDIGKLPDSSIAESIGRLPGIAAQRTNGRAQSLSIRGLGPDFTVTTFNGREQATTSENRSVEFDQYPSELVTQVKIYKTPDAGMTYQGVAGTTDIQTIHPLAYNERKTSATYRREYDAQKANVPGLPRSGDRANLTYVDQFMDHTLGVAFGVAFDKTPYQAQTREPWGYADSGLGNGTTVIGGDKDGVQSSFYERLGYLGVLEWKPNDNLHMTVDAFHSNFKELQTVQRMEFGTVWAGSALSNPGPVVNNRVTSGTFANVPFTVIENYNNDNHAKLDSLGWNTELKVNEDWSLEGDLSWSKVKQDKLRLESTGGTGAGADPLTPPTKDTITFTTDANGITHFNTNVNYSDYNTTFLSDPGGWGGGPTRAGFVGHPSTQDEVKAIRLSADRKLGAVFSDVKFGVNYAERTKSKYEWQGQLRLQGGLTHAVVPDAFRTGIASTAFFGNPYGMISYDALGLYRSGFFSVTDARIDPTVNDNDQSFDFTNTWTVKEKLTTAFVKFGIDTQLGDVPVTGNIGVQTVTADQTSLLYLINPTRVQVPGGFLTTASQGTFGKKYTDVLPSLNLNFQVAEQTKLRFAAAVTETRPRMDEMAGGASYSVVSDSSAPILINNKPYYWSRNGGGNPNLRPWKANAVDLSLEHYFGNKGYISLATYYKQLTSYIFPQSQFASFVGAQLPTTVPNGPTYTLADANRIGVATVKANGSGGSIKGVEFTASVPFELFAEPLKGFGFLLSAAVNSSQVTISGQKTAVPGLSTHVYNSTLYYENHGFSARVSNRYRGTFIGEVPNFDSSLGFRNVNKESLFDAQVGYEFTEGFAKGLTVNLSGTNLTDEPFVLSNVGDTPYNFVKYEKYGAVYALSLNYKF